MRISNHKLAWRWTDPAYAVLPDEILVQMQPLPPDQANVLHSRALAFLGRGGLHPDLRPEIVRTENASLEECASWLKEHEPYMEIPVLLSWSADTALQTTWGIFLSYWPEFCYPASDDLVVLPKSDAWVLLYHHEQEFHFGRPAAYA